MSSGETDPVIRTAKALCSINEMLLNGNRDPETLLRYIQPVIAQPETYADALNPPRQASFVAGFEPELWVPDWEKFYREVYGIADMNLSPAFRQPTEHLDHAWPVFCVPGVGLNRTWAECRNLHPAHSYLGDDLEAVVTKNDRSAANGPYMVRFRARVEADVEYMGLSANELAKRGISGITFDERLKLGQFVWWKTGGFHLDLVTVTLCAGSRYRGGEVPRVDWRGYQLYVNYCGPDGGFGHVRTRSAVL